MKYGCLLVALLLVACDGETSSVDGGTDNPPSGQVGEAGAPPPIVDAGPPPSGGLADVLSREMFAMMFPQANGGEGPTGSPFNYDNLLHAAADHPTFGTTGNNETRLREIAGLFAHVIQETANSGPELPREQGGLWFTQELGCESGCPAYSNSCTVPDMGSQGRMMARTFWAGWAYPCAEGQSYHGRGAHQLSYNYNYGMFSRYLFDGDATVLLNDPDRVIRDGRLAFLSAIWFWMTPRSPKPSMHDIIVGAWTPAPEDTSAGRLPGFGATINVINPIECGGSSEDARAQNRIAAYRHLCGILGVEPGDNLGCANMPAFSVMREDLPMMYLEQDWTGRCGCHPVAYETPFLTGIAGDMERCVEAMRTPDQPPFFLETACMD